MIRKLQIKLLAISMLSLFLVLLLIMGGVNVVNYRDILRDADNTLYILAENGGHFPKLVDHRDDKPRLPDSGMEGSLWEGSAWEGSMLEGSAWEDHSLSDHSFGDSSFSSLSSGGGPHGRGISEELPYETRFYSVLMEADGQVVSVDTGKIAAVDTETAMEHARQVYASGEIKGFVSDYRFVRHQETNGQLRMIFLDCGRNLRTFRSFLLASCGISVVGLLAVLLLMVLFSRRIVRPVSESYEKQKQFITDAGHEIKTPISIIDADAEVLEMELGDNEWLQDIRHQTKRLASLTGDLIFLSRMEEEQVVLQRIEFPFSDLVEERAQSFQALARSQDKTFAFRVQPMVALVGDEKSLGQLVDILLDNALKYSPPGGQVALNLEKSGKNVVLTVENTVENLAKEDLPRMFERFYRGDKSRSSETGGYGIGLSIAKAVVEAHKGKISAASPETDHIKITVSLPGT